MDPVGNWHQSDLKSEREEGHGVKAQWPSVVMDEKDIVVGH
jgi:hypothetical protein